jgi:FkbM family methyltransferase|tara:strand:+ start:230 stop:1000 length:771 start_codon:yes stop_codon:yes gene_type:complete
MKFRSIFIKIPILRRLYPSLAYKVLTFFKKSFFIYKFRDVFLYLNINDPIDRSVFLFDHYEDPQINYLHKLFKDNKINYFFDVGSNCGIYTLIFGKLFKDVKILSFEPIQSTFLKLKKNISLNAGLRNIKKYNYGLSNKSSKLKVKTLIKKKFIQSGGFSVVNKKDNLKNLHTEYASFKKGDEKFKIKNKTICLKIDVERHEICVLNGLSRMLRNNKIILQIEILSPNYNSVYKKLHTFGFKKINQIKNDFYFIKS